jgi:hypothetical protein
MPWAAFHGRNPAKRQLSSLEAGGPVGGEIRERKRPPSQNVRLVCVVTLPILRYQRVMGASSKGTFPGAAPLIPQFFVSRTLIFSGFARCFSSARNLIGKLDEAFAFQDEPDPFERSFNIAAWKRNMRETVHVGKC